MTEEVPVPFTPLPMHPEAPSRPSEVAGAPSPEVVLVYVRYRDPNPLEFPDRPERIPGPIFHAGGILLREDDEFLALGEVALREENPLLEERYGKDLFPAYRNVLTVPKGTIVERRDVRIHDSRSGEGIGRDALLGQS